MRGGAPCICENVERVPLTHADFPKSNELIQFFLKSQRWIDAQ